MVANKKIIFRADGNSEIGLGHLMRCIALAQMLNRCFECEIATRFTTDFLLQELNKNFSNVHILLKDDRHYNEFINFLTGDEIVVLDNYFFTTSYQLQIKRKGCNLVCIDDKHNKHFVSDVIINHAPRLSESVYSKNETTKCFLGFDYVMLRQPFLEAVRCNNSKQKSINESVTINFGGIDHYNLTLKYLKYLDKLDFFREINLLVSGNYKYFNQLYDYLSQNHHINCTIHVDLSDDKLIYLFLKSSFGIASASTVSFEMLSVKIPMMVGYYVDNQMDIYNGLKSIKGITKLGNLIHLNEKDFILTFRNVALQNVKFENPIIDGHSDDRIVNIFKELNE